MTPVLFSGKYSRELCQAHPDKIFVFGDNLQRVGMGGQAIIRPEPNIVGIPTKRSPGEFMVEGSASDMLSMVQDLKKVDRLMVDSRLVFPIDIDGNLNIGNGLAELPQRAPTLFAFLQAWFAKLKREQGL